MTRGVKALLLSSCLIASGCAADHSLHVRAIPDSNGKLRYSGGLLAEARGQLAMGAVGLALESFQTLQREQPNSSDAYAGIAACYAAMGRYDLTRKNYELALAFEPDDPALLQALASTLDKLGEAEQAAQVRTEARMAATPPSETKEAQHVLTPLGVPRMTSTTVKLPEATSLKTSPSDTATRPTSFKLRKARVDLPPARPATLGKPVLAADAEVAIKREPSSRVLNHVDEPPIAILASS